MNPKLRYVGDDKSLLALDELWDIYALAIHNIKQSREREADKFLKYPIPKCNVGDKVVVRSCARDVWDPKYDVANHMVQLMVIGINGWK